MKKKFLLLLLMALYGKTLFAEEYTFYYRQTQLAEECLLNEEFESALKHYDSTFQRYEFRFARDCYIAAQTAAYLKNDSLTYKFLVYSLKAGIRQECLNNKLFKPFKETSYFTRLQGDTGSLRQEYMRGIDHNLSIELTKRYNKEQALKNGNGWQSAEQYFDQIDENFFWIKKLLSENKYPGEQICGLKNAIEPAVNHNPLTNCFYASEMGNVSLRHFPYSYDLLKNELKKSMMAGQIHPVEVVNIIIFSKTRLCRYRQTKPDFVKSVLLESEYEQLCFGRGFEQTMCDLDLVNKNRQEWFLPKTGLKLTAEDLNSQYGVNIMIGEW